MKILIFVTTLFFFLSGSPEKLANLDDLVILSDCDLDTTEFYGENLQMLWDMDGRFDIKLKMATCSLPHESGTTDFDAMTAGIQHPVVIAVNSSLEIIGKKAALPCPPHCSGKLATTFESFMRSH